MSRRLARTRRRSVRRAPSRRGAALFLTLLLTTALTALALCAISLSSSSALLTKYYDRERDFRYAAEAGLALGRAKLAKDPSIAIPDSGSMVLLPATTITDASGTAVPRAQVTVYAGRSGAASGQFGVFATLVAQAQDQSGTRHVRRLELAAENFARYAMFTDTWQSGLCYGTGEYIRGLAWSNGDWQSCGSPEYSDSVSAVGRVSGGSPVYKKGSGSVHSGVSPIPLPTVARLSSLPGYAAAGNLSFSLTAGRAMMRIEFVPADLDKDGVVTDPAEGFLRVFEAYSLPDAAGTPSVALGKERGRAAGWWAPVSGDAVSSKMPPAFADSLCGDFHNNKFFPVAVHTRAWFLNPSMRADANALDKLNPPTDATTADSVVTDDLRERVLASGKDARCYPAGDPHLAAVERLADTTNAAAWKKTWVGGTDTTFVPAGRWGTWRDAPGAPAPALKNVRPWDATYLFPLSTTYNSGFKGVIYVSDDVWVSGVLRGMVTLYGAKDVRFVDDLTYATNPAAPVRSCRDLDQLDMLGVISAQNVMIDSNSINRPQRWRRTPSTTTWNVGDFRFLSANQDFYLHGVTMALTGTVGVDGYNTGPYATRACGATGSSGGCIYQVGGVIEKYITATFDGSKTGFAENRSSDKCMQEVSPPYFPTTGRYFNNRYYEVDPARFDVTRLFRELQAGQ